MNASRNRVKAHNRELNSQLQAQVEAAQIRREKKCLYSKRSELMFTLGNLIFGGILVGGLFKEGSFPYLLYSIGVLVFLVLYLWGYYSYKKSIRIKD